jgi:hypothetical protein
MMTEHKFLKPEPGDDTPAGLSLTRGELKRLYNALLLDVLSDEEKSLPALELLEKILKAIKDATR